MERSLGQFRSARAILADLVRAEPGIVRYSRALSSSYEFLGRRLSQMARDDEALAEYRQALAVTENLLAAHGADATIMGDAFNLELRMAVLFQKLGECDRAVEFANRILNPRSPETGRAIVNQAEAVRNACTCKK